MSNIASEASRPSTTIHETRQTVGLGIGSTPRAAACFRSRVNLRAAGSWPWVPPARDSSETAGTIILRMAGNIQ